MEKRRMDNNSISFWCFSVAKVHKKEQLHRADAIRRLKNEPSLNAARHFLFFSSIQSL